MIRIPLRMGVGLVVVLGVLFGSAGRWDLPFFWAWLGVLMGSMALVMATIDRELLRERDQPGPGGKDRHMRLVFMPIFLAHMVIAGLDVGRFHFSDTVPVWLRIAGLVGLALCLATTAWIIRVNRFFSPVVRIQKERGHYLISHGPYAWVRHPGYLSSLPAFPLGGLALGSWWALAPLVAGIFLLLRRTVIEDRFLREHLAGYEEYSERVRYRLVPGLW